MNNCLPEGLIGDSFLCSRNPKRARRLRKLRRQSRRKLSASGAELITAIVNLILALALFGLPFWMALAGLMLERLCP